FPAAKTRASRTGRGSGATSGPGKSDMVLHNVNTGAFEVYDIAGNNLVGAASLGAVGLDWQLGGFAATGTTTTSSSTTAAAATALGKHGSNWPHTQGREASGSAGHTGEQVRIHHQPANGQGARH